MSVVPGNTCWIDLTAVGNHLHVVLSYPTDEGKVLVANLTTYRGKSHEDVSCILSVGDHPDITHESWVVYDNAKLYDSAYLLKIGLADSLTPIALARVLDGAMQGDRIKMSHYELLRDQGLIETD